MGKNRILITSISIMIAFLAACSTNDKVAVKDIDLSRIPDGTYKGSYQFAPNDRSVYHVTTTVKNHRIVAIDLQFDQRIRSKFTTMAKAVFNRIIEKQKISVDVVTGATKTSREYMKAVENSLLRENK